MDSDKDVGENGNARKCEEKQTRRRRVHPVTGLRNIRLRLRRGETGR